MNPLFKNLGKDLMTFGRQRLMDAASDVTEAGLDNVPQGTNVNYVRVIGSDGESYKIEKEAFMGLIRDALPAVLSNLNGNIAQVFGKAANGGMGYETVQSLASVLGAPLPKGILTVSANTIFENSAYCLYGNENLDVPTDYGVLITLRSTNSYTGYWGLQFIFNVGAVTALYYRTGSATKQEWGSWKSIIMP